MKRDDIMSKTTNLPPFVFLGQQIQKVKFDRLGNEKIDEIRIKVASANFNEAKKIYSVILIAEIDFENSKGNIFQLLGGFQINDLNVLSNENMAVSMFSASLYPYLRSLILNVTADERRAIKLPSVDLRLLDLSRSLVFKVNQKDLSLVN